MKKLISIITNWEAWPFKLLYAPITPVWGWYMLRSGSVWFFTPSNPKITFGGMDGEPKKEMYDLLPKKLYPATFNVLPIQPFEPVILTHTCVLALGVAIAFGPEPVPGNTANTGLQTSPTNGILIHDSKLNPVCAAFQLQV